MGLKFLLPLALTVLMFACGGSGGGGGNLPAAPAPPVIYSTSPQSVAAGGLGFTITILGSNYFPDSKVYWNGSPRPTTFQSSTTLQAAITAQDISQISAAQIQIVNPTSEGGSSLVKPFSITIFGTWYVPELSNDLAWDPHRGVLYASVSATSRTNGNSILKIDPATGTILASVYAGNEPNRLAISDDGQFLYVGLDGSNAIKRLTLPDLTTDISIPLGSDPYLSSSPYAALDIQVAPGLPHTIAVSLGILNISPQTVGGVAIFDDNLPRPTKADGFWGNYRSIQWGASATSLYGASDAYDFYLLTVNADGVTLTKSIWLAFSRLRNRIHFDPTTNRIYSDSGMVLDPATGQSVGAFPSELWAIMTPNAPLNAAFFLSPNAGEAGFATLSAYDLTHFTPAYSIIIPAADAGSFPTRLVPLGSLGLACGGYRNPISIYSGPFFKAIPSS